MNKVIALCIVFLVFACGCNKPTAKIIEISVQDSNPSNVILKCKVRIDNPYPAPISITSFDYRLTVNGDEFLNGNMPSGDKIPANLSKEIDLQLIVKLANLFTIAPAIQQEGVVKYLAKVRAMLYAPAYGSLTLTLQKQGQFELFAETSQSKDIIEGIEGIIEETPQE